MEILPYLQYTYARISSVYDKYKEKYHSKNLEKYEINISEVIN